MLIFEISSFLGLPGYHRRFENGLKLSIRGWIIGFHLWDSPDHREREIKDARSTQDEGVDNKREDQPSSSTGKRQKTYASH